MYQIGKQFLLLFVLIFIQISLLVSHGPAQTGKLIIDKPNQLQTDTTAAMAFYFNQEYESAETAFKVIAEINPTFTTALIYLADSQLYQGKKDLANKNYQKAYSLLADKLENRKRMLPKLKNPGIYSEIIYCLNALGRYEEAKKVGLWGTIEGEVPDLFINLGYTFHKLGRDDIAIRNYCKFNKLTAPYEMNNLYHQRINNLFEPDKGWYVKCSDDEKRNPGTNYALIIGVGKYKDPSINSLRYVENDVRELYHVLTNTKTGTFRPNNIMTLINEDATEKNIKFKLDDLATKANGKDDMVLVFYAGRGFSYPSSKDTYWLTYDTIVGDKTGNRIKSTAFSNMTLASKIADIQADRFIFFIDACYSAGMVEKQVAVRGLDSYLGVGKAYTIITSSKADQLSIESPKFQNGLFTYALVTGLSGKADMNNDGWVEIDELWPFIKYDISNRAKQMGSEQNPVRSGSAGGSLRISKNPDYK